MTETDRNAPRPGALWRSLARVATVLVFVWLLHLLYGWASQMAASGEAGLRFWLLAGFLLAYALLIAIPFVPGVEVGLTLLAMAGPAIAPMIYLATVLGLVLAYVAGEWLPHARLRQVLADLRLTRACRFIERVQPLDRAARLDLLQHRAPGWARPLVSRFRYLMLALLINLPGNSVLGGGGGILFMAGFSRLFRPWATLLTLVVAVAPVPAAVWFLHLDVRGLFG